MQRNQQMTARITTSAQHPAMLCSFGVARQRAADAIAVAAAAQLAIGSSKRWALPGTAASTSTSMH
jgi:hypothetical protein